MELWKIIFLISFWCTSASQYCSLCFSYFVVWFCWPKGFLPVVFQHVVVTKHLKLADFKLLEMQIESTRFILPGKLSGKHPPDCFLKMVGDLHLHFFCYVSGHAMELLPAKVKELLPSESGSSVVDPLVVYTKQKWSSLLKRIYSCP